MPSARESEKLRTELLRQELGRASALVDAKALAHSDVTVRRSAARALARIADERASDLLGPALSDEDPEVLSWAAYGLGFACKEREAGTVRALAVRLSSLLVRGMEPPTARDLLHPLRALVDGLSRCGTPEAQRVLVSWLGRSWPGEPSKAFAEEAAIGLGKLASRKEQLDEASIVALLDAADDPKAPLENALFAFSRLGPLDPSVQARILELAKARLLGEGRGRTFALRALGRAGPAAAPALLAALDNASLSPPDRALAVRSLGELGEAGQDALAEILREATPTDEELVQGNFGGIGYAPLITLLESLKAPTAATKPVLERLAVTPLAVTPLAVTPLAATPLAARGRLARRISRLRCQSAALLARENSKDPRLMGCDPEKSSRVRSLARLLVLGRNKIRGAALQHWLELVGSDDAAVREAALDLMPGHPEIDDPASVLAARLLDQNPGVVASAAGALAAQPDRGTRVFAAPAKSPDGTLAPRPDASVVQSLRAAFERTWPPDAIETESALIDAAGALELLVLRPRIEAYCGHGNATLRQHAEKALIRMGLPKPRCLAKTTAPFDGFPKDPAEGHAESYRLEFTTDAGVLPMTLVTRFAPLTVTEVVGLVRSGFYDGVAIHRVVPGFVVQFGDPDADGYGGAPRAPLPCETSPIAFDAWNVGVALAGRDTGTSQLFVTLGPFPHLDGSYAWLGQASPKWQELDKYDRILKAVVVDSK